MQRANSSWCPRAATTTPPPFSVRADGLANGRLRRVNDWLNCASAFTFPGFWAIETGYTVDS
jgi:hypothetical protein